jgi:1-pyrroline-4-hydroxy-2-carboxylate deaminase
MNYVSQPWHGVLVATALPYNDDLSVDFYGYAWQPSRQPLL